MRERKVDPWEIRNYKVQSVVCGEVFGESGLGSHCEYDFHVSGLSGGLIWVVDHLASGCKIAQFNGQARVRVFIEEIAGYTDWTTSLDVLKSIRDEKFWKEVQKAAALAETWTPKEAKKLLQMRKQVSLWKEQGVS